MIHGRVRRLRQIYPVRRTLRNMNYKAALLALLLVSSSLAGCTGSDTSDLDQQIDDLQQSNDEMNETIGQLNQDNADLQQSLDEKSALISEYVTSIDMLNQQIEDSQSDISDLQEQLSEAEEFRDSILLLLDEFVNYSQNLTDDWNELANDYNILLEALEAANNSIQTLQTDLVIQQDLVIQWQQTAEDNRADLSGANLFNANLNNANLNYANLSGCLLYTSDAADE